MIKLTLNNKQTSNPIDILLEIAPKECLATKDYYLQQHGSEDYHDKLLQDFTESLKDQVERHLVELSTQLVATDLLATIDWLKQTVQALQFSLAYEILGAEKADPILLPLRSKLMIYENKVAVIRQSLDNICAKAAPGIIIQDFVREEVASMIAQRFFKTAPEIGPVILVKFLNNPYIVREIHEKIIATRVASCLPYIHDVGLLRQELRKVTVYRVRRNLISALFILLLKKYDGFNQHGIIISRDDESILMALQEEYLHAIYRQIEKIDHKAVGNFLESFKSDLVLQPLPKSSRLGEQVDLAQREYQYLLENYSSPSNDYLQEGVPLHDIDCPIEMDVLGEMSHQLIEASSQELEEMEDANVIMEDLERTYQDLQSPNFTVITTWIDDFERHRYEPLKEDLLQEKNLLLRLTQIEMLYVQLLLEKKKRRYALHRLYHLLMRTHKALLQWCQQHYLETLAQVITSAALHSPRDKYILYRCVIAPHLQSALGVDLKLQSEQNKKLMGLLQLLCDKPIVS